MSATFPGTANLASELDKRVLLVLRDGRHLVGMMRSFDQYSNIVLEDTVERHVVGDCYSDIALGLYLIRGENLAFIGELDEEMERNHPILKQVSPGEILQAEAALQVSGTKNVRSAWNFDQEV